MPLAMKDVERGGGGGIKKYPGRGVEQDINTCAQ